MSQLHDEFVADIGRSESVDDNVHSLLETIADRIDACKGNRVRLSDLATILREDHQAVSAAVQEIVVLKPTPAEIEADRTTAERADEARKASEDKKAADDRARKFQAA